MRVQSMPRYRSVAGLLSLAVLAGCERVHLVQDPPGIPPAFADSPGLQWNAGRVQSIAISPASNKRALVAMEFGGLWGTNNGGDSWFRIFSLPAVMVGDVEFGDDGNTVVATVFRDNQVANGGGIYVSHDRGGSWSRPATGVVPPTPSIARTSAYGISRAPDDTRLWYVGTDFGVAISTDNGDTWTHKALEATSRRWCRRRWHFRAARCSPSRKTRSTGATIAAEPGAKCCRTRSTFTSSSASTRWIAHPIFRGSSSSANIIGTRPTPPTNSAHCGSMSSTPTGARC
jgi:hypothetical protein